MSGNVLGELRLISTDESAEIGVDLTEKQDVDHIEHVNHELMNEDAKEEIATVEPVPGRLTVSV